MLPKAASAAPTVQPHGNSPARFVDPANEEFAGALEALLKRIEGHVRRHETGALTAEPAATISNLSPELEPEQSLVLSKGRSLQDLAPTLGSCMESRAHIAVSRSGQAEPPEGCH